MSLINTTTKVYKSITLSPGEEFVLPPDGVLKASSDVSSLTSSCDIASLDTIECYGVYLGTTFMDGDNHTWQNVSIVGALISGVKHPFSTPLDFYEDGSTGDVVLVNSNPNLSLLMSPCLHTDGGDHQRGTTYSIVFKAPTQTMKNAYFYGTGDRGSAGGDGPAIDVMFPIKSKADLEASGVNTCDCA